MPDLLTHVLLAYALTAFLTHRYDWLSPAYVTLAMVGAFFPDLDHISAVVPRQTVKEPLGIPFG